jgi:hypothetical protein
MWMLSEMAIYFPETTTLKELRILAEKIVTWCKNDKVSCWEINDFINEYSTGKPILEEYPVTGTFYEKRP